MLNGEQRKIVVHLIRRNARILRREPCDAMQMLRLLSWGVAEEVPERFLMPFTACLHGVIGDARLDESVLPLSIRTLFREISRCGAANLAALDGFGAGIRTKYGAATEDAVLAGDVAALAALYQDPGAFQAAGWEALLKDGTCANGAKTRKLAPPAEDWSEEIQFGTARWRKPKPALMIAFFARDVGDPATPPNPPMWPHLGLALLVWKDRIAVTEILELAARLGRRDEVEHGLAIATHIFPELKSWAHPEKWAIPQWERKWAVPLAARRVVLVNYE